MKRPNPFSANLLPICVRLLHSNSQLIGFTVNLAILEQASIISVICSEYLYNNNIASIIIMMRWGRVC